MLLVRAFVKLQLHLQRYVNLIAWNSPLLNGMTPFKKVMGTERLLQHDFGTQYMATLTFLCRHRNTVSWGKNKNNSI